jgi:endonuclease YncB( thermonuclease family)
MSVRRRRQGATWQGALWAVVVWLATSVPAAAGETRSALVEHVVDGDTAFVNTSPGPRLKCRLAGIDAPEVRHRRRGAGEIPGQPFGLEAKRALEQWALRHRVTVDFYGRDTYHRSLCVLHAAGRNLNLEMVREGYAWAVRGRRVDVSPALRQELQAAESEARAARRGLWADPNPEAPWVFRRRVRGGGRY